MNGCSARITLRNSSTCCSYLKCTPSVRRRTPRPDRTAWRKMPLLEKPPCSSQRAPTHALPWKRNIIPPVNKKAVQIEGMPAMPHGPIFRQVFLSSASDASSIRPALSKPKRFQHFPSPRNYRYGWPQPTAQRNGQRLQQYYYIQADFFCAALLGRTNEQCGGSAANTIPIGYATAVL